MPKIDLAPFLRFNGFFPFQPIDIQFVQLMDHLLTQEKLSLTILQSIQSGYSRGTLETLTAYIMNLKDFSEAAIRRALEFLDYVEYLMSAEGIFLDPESVIKALQEIILEDLETIHSAQHHQNSPTKE